MPTYTYVSVDRVTPRHGTTAGGTAVTITGYGFDLATGVTFDGTTATDIVYVSMTSITCVTPRHASGSVDVVVEGVGTLEDGYTYQIPLELLPPYPYYSPLEEGGTRTISKPWADWLRVVKQRIETLPGDVPAEDVIGVLDVDNIPQLPFTRITMNAPRLLGRTSAGEGDAEEITVASNLVLQNGTLSLLGLPNGYTIGDLLYADAATSLALLNAVSAGSYLRSGGVATAPLWSTLKLPNAATAGDILFATGSDTYSSQSPAALTRVDDTNVTLTLGGTPATALVKAVSLTLGWSGQLGVTRGGTGLATVTTGDLLYGSAADTLSRRAIGSAGDVLTVSGGLPVWAPTSGLGTGDLTKGDDTNVTLTLGGTPTGSLFKSVSITAGWTGTLGLARGGTAADLSATGGSGKYLKQASAGAAITVASITAAEITSGAALTKTDDTNVTLTLGGSASTALLAASSLTLGWTGTLGLSRGGTNANLSATGGSNQVLKQSSSGAAITVGTLASTNLSDTADLAYLSAANTFAANIQRFTSNTSGHTVYILGRTAGNHDSAIIFRDDADTTSYGNLSALSSLGGTFNIVSGGGGSLQLNSNGVGIYSGAATKVVRQQNDGELFADGLGTDTGTTLIITAGNLIKAQSSSRRYKHHVAAADIPQPILDRFLAVSPVWWDYTGQRTGALGFITEDLATIPLSNRHGRSALINYDGQGRPDSNRDFTITALHHLILQDIAARIAALEHGGD